MNGIWLVSHLALWLMVILLLLAVLALARQIGLLHRRMGTASARMENAGPEIGELVPELRAVDLGGREVRLGSERGKQTLLAFISAQCSSCDELAPALRSIWKSERNSLDVLLISIGGDEESNRDFLARHDLDQIPYIVSTQISLLYRVPSPPYALVIDKDRKLLAKGVANHLEHLESLLNAAKLRLPSSETLLAARRHKPDAVTIAESVSRAGD